MESLKHLRQRKVEETGAEYKKNAFLEPFDPFFQCRRVTIRLNRISLLILFIQIQRDGGARPGLTGALQPGPPEPERVREGKGLPLSDDCRRSLRTWQEGVLFQSPEKDLLQVQGFDHGLRRGSATAS